MIPQFTASAYVRIGDEVIRHSVHEKLKSWVGSNAKEKFEKTRIHPTQKPMELYGYLLHKFAKSGDRILDTFLGSGSICLAAHDLGFEMLGIEIDPVYYNAAQKRLIAHQQQTIINF